MQQASAYVVARAASQAAGTELGAVVVVEEVVERVVLRDRACLVVELGAADWRVLAGSLAEALLHQKNGNHSQRIRCTSHTLPRLQCPLPAHTCSYRMLVGQGRDHSTASCSLTANRSM